MVVFDRKYQPSFLSIFPLVFPHGSPFDDQDERLHNPLFSPLVPNNPLRVFSLIIAFFDPKRLRNGHRDSTNEVKLSGVENRCRASAYKFTTNGP